MLDCSSWPLRSSSLLSLVAPLQLPFPDALIMAQCTDQIMLSHVAMASGKFELRLLDIHTGSASQKTSFMHGCHSAACSRLNGACLIK